ncbi:MAG TPA: hypothetical protein VKG26_15620 [Bacteroidia bacterium]|nr:hypothetical protein [Bacteroidia bacterium]
MVKKIKVQYIIFFGFLISFNAFAQSADTSATSSIDLIYGYRIFNNSFYNQLNSVSHFDYKLPVQLVGIAVSDNYTVNKYVDYYGHISYCQTIPQTIQLQNTNSKISGFVFGIDYGISIGPGKNFKVLIGGGFNAGRLKLYENNQIDLKNPFFSPKICIQPKIAIKRFVISFRAEYDFDISNTAWEKKSRSSINKINISNFKQNCFTPQLCIGMLI